MIDWYNISIIWRSARVTRKRRAKLSLPPLRDPNDLPDPPTAEVLPSDEPHDTQLNFLSPRTVLGRAWW